MAGICSELVEKGNCAVLLEFPNAYILVPCDAQSQLHDVL